MQNPLIDDRFMRFLLDEVHDAASLCALPRYAEHDAESFRMYAEVTRRFARTELFPTYKPMDAEPPELRDGRIHVHPQMKALYPKLLEMGSVTATRAFAVGGQQLPRTVAWLVGTYLSAANLSAMAYVWLTAGAAHLIESFGDDWLKETFMAPMYAGEWTGTMALTEPHAGSSLADVTTMATPTDDGHWLIKGSKIFISGGDQDLTENVVHLLLAKTPNAPAGVRGISLFAVPRMRPGKGGLVFNDVITSQLIHKIGWRGLPSLGLTYGEADDCHGWLVGSEGHGLKYMFQMMNEARILVGAQAASTASVAYHQAVQYARERPQGRPITGRDPSVPQIAIIEHADVRRMLLRQKAIVEGSLCLLGTVARYADTAEEDSEAAGLLDLLTPVVKTFPSEYGYEANALALQVHGGYGYTDEYLPESWLRDQKLNTIHEGTTGIQGLDLLGRRAMRGGGATLQVLARRVGEATAAARAAGFDAEDCDRMDAATQQLAQITMALGAQGMQNPAAMLDHSHDYLTLFSLYVVSWQWIVMAAHAPKAPKIHQALWQTARYWLRTELPNLDVLAARCTTPATYAEMQPEWF